MIVREGQIYRHIKNINQSDKIDDLSQINYDLDFEVVKADNERVVIKHLIHKVEKFCDLKTFNDSFIYITTPSEQEDKPKIKIGDVVRIKKDPAYIEVMGYNEVLNLWHGKYYGRSLSRPFINFDIKDVVSVLDESIKEEDKPKNKYHRDLKGVTVDVYDVLKAFEVTDPALQHLIKKALCAGLRGHKNKDQDLQDILDSAKRAVELND